MFAEVNGVRLHYVQEGKGAPVILLHGNGEDHTIFDGAMHYLAKTFCVFAVDSRDHGQSSKTGKLSYEAMAEDIAAFIEALSLQGAGLIGFSDGGIIGLLLAIRHPELLGALVACGASTRPDGLKLRWRLMIRVGYVFGRDPKLALMLHEPQITPEQLGQIHVPTLVLAGSRDIIVQSHTEALAGAIDASVLKILPDETHDSYIKDWGKLCEHAAPFLRENLRQQTASLFVDR